MEATQKYYDLTKAEQLLIFAQKFSIYKQVNNIFTLLLVDKKIDFSILTKAIELAFELCDTLRTRFTKVNGKIKQYFIASYKPQINTLDFSGQTQEEMDKKLYKISSKPIKILNSSMIRIYLVHSCNDMYGFYFGVSHIVLDTWGIYVVMKYIMDVYHSLKNNTAMPKPLYPYEQLLAIELAYKDTPQYQKDLAFWKQEWTREEPWFTHINGPSVLEAYRKKKKNPILQSASGFTLRTRSNVEIIQIPAEEIAQMESFCTAYKIPMQTLFMLAFRTCLSMLNNRQPDITFCSPIARRATLEEKYSGGTRASAVFIRTIIPEDCSFLDALKQVQSQQSQLYKHANMDLLEVIKLRSDAYFKGDPMPTHSTATLTFQPVKLTLSNGELCYTKWYSNGAAPQVFYTIIMDDNGSGALRCHYEYHRSIVKRQRIIDFHTYMVKVILAGVHNPEITVGQLLNLEKAEDVSTALAAETAASVAMGE